MIGTISHSVPGGSSRIQARVIFTSPVNAFRIRQNEGSSAGDLDDAHLCQRRLEAEHALAHPSTGELRDGRHVGGDVNRELGSQPISDLDGAGGAIL